MPHVMTKQARSIRSIALGIFGLAALEAVWTTAACNATTAANCSTNSETGSQEGSDMSPGSDCMNCHSGGRGGGFKLAGTVMGAYTDSTECDGVSGATITITDAAGKITTLTSGSVGNFFSEASFTAPYTAKISRNGKELAMQTPQTDGACNSCHAETGLNNAPGRIVAP